MIERFSKILNIFKTFVDPNDYRLGLVFVEEKRCFGLWAYNQPVEWLNEEV